MDFHEYHTYLYFTTNFFWSFIWPSLESRWNGNSARVFPENILNHFHNGQTRLDIQQNLGMFPLSGHRSWIPSQWKRILSHKLRFSHSVEELIKFIAYDKGLPHWTCSNGGSTWREVQAHIYLKPGGKQFRKPAGTSEQKLNEPQVNEVSTFHFRTPPLISISQWTLINMAYMHTHKGKDE